MLAELARILQVCFRVLKVPARFPGVENTRQDKTSVLQTPPIADRLRPQDACFVQTEIFNLRQPAAPPDGLTPSPTYVKICPTDG